MLQTLTIESCQCSVKFFMSSSCLFYEIQFIAFNWYHGMSNFNKIRYGAVIEFLMLDNVQPQVIHNWMTVVCGEDVLSYAMVK